MKVLFIVRSTLFSVRGGDTVQVEQTARALGELGIEADIKSAHEKIDYSPYQLLHFFNIIRPADMLVHIKKSGKPFVVSSILVDYSAYDKYNRKGIAGLLLRMLSADGGEYVKTVYRFIKRKDKLPSTSYLWKGQRRSIRFVLQSCRSVLVNAEEEYKDLVKRYGIEAPYAIVQNGVDAEMFTPDEAIQKDERMVLCAARIEGIKNQYNLIRALNDTPYKLLLIGNPAPNQQNYYERCKKIASANISFIDHLPVNELKEYYARAKVHVLPSWFEVCGLSSLEAAAMGCNVVITDNGYPRSYFGDDAFYCNPGIPDSILDAVIDAANAKPNAALQKRIVEQYNWKRVAEKIKAVYQKHIAC